MTNKLIKRKYNNLLTARNHYFKYGDFLFKPGDNGQVTNRSLNNMSSLGTGLMSAAGTAIGQLGGGAIGGGLQSGVGNVFQGLSGVASAIPGPWGAVTSAGLGLLGGLTNRMFGSKLNTENIAKVEANINALKGFQSNASSFDSLAANFGSAPVGMDFSDSFIGKDGWFSDDAKEKAAELREGVATGRAWVSRSLSHNADNINLTQMQNLLANKSAYGGPLFFSQGGGIHIKPSKRGTFTAAATKHGMGVQEFASKVLANKNNYSPAMVKKANFAKNASKWHAFGGDLMTHGANFDTGLTLVGNGGTHEENPNEGVPMGMDSEGIPNLVEEGEVIFNDYVFSKRLKVPKIFRKKYKLGGPLTFADAAIKMGKESEERPNDPISQTGLEDSMMKLMIAQEELREKTDKTRKYAKGGKMGRLYLGTGPDPNILRGFAVTPFEGTTPIYITGGGPGVGINPTAPKTSGNVVNPKIPYIKTPPAIVQDLEGSPLPYENLSQAASLAAHDAKIERTTIAAGRKRYTENPEYAPTWMRKLPAYASGIMAFTDALGQTNKPDYGEADAALEAAKGAGTYTPIKFNPVGNQLGLKLFDRDYYINKLNEQSGATRRALLNTSSGNRATAMAGLLASDYNAQSKLGDLFRQAEEYNFAQRQKVEDFNRATNMFNSEGMFKADAANQSALLQARSSYLKGALTAAELRQRERQTSTAARSANLSNFINSLGDIGRENFSRNMIISDPSKYYWIGNNGAIHYKGAYNNLSEKEKKEIDKEIASKRKAANVGYLTIKRRKR